MKKFLMAILLLFSTFSFAEQKPFEPAFVERYKNQGHEDGQIIGYNSQISAFNYYVHKLFKLSPELADRMAKVYNVIDEKDSLGNAYSPEALRVIKEKHSIISKIFVVSTYILSLLMLLYFILSLIDVIKESLAKKLTISALFWLLMSITGVAVTLPVFDGGTNTFQLLIYKTAFWRLEISQTGLSTNLADEQVGQFNITKDDYQGKSENVIAELYTKTLHNIALQYLESSKYYFRNNDPTDIYARAEDFVHVTDNLISFYMPQSSHGYQGQSLYLFQGGSIELNFIEKLPQNTVDAIYPVVITPVDDQALIAEKASEYEAELRKNKVTEEHLKIAMFYFHNNSVLNVVKKNITEDFLAQVKAVEFTEAVACESEPERRIKAQKAISSGIYENNYCLVKSGDSIKLMNLAGNKEAAQKIITAVYEKNNSLRFTTSKSFFSTLQNTDTNNLLVDALHYGTKFYFSNYARIKYVKQTDNVLAVLLNNNMKFNAIGRDSFIDDAALHSRKNSEDILNLNDAYASVVSIYNAKPSSMMDVDLAESSKEYLTNKSNMASDNDNSGTLIEAIKTISKEVRKIISPPADCTDNCYIELDNEIVNQKIGSMLINYGVMLKSTKYVLSFMDTSNDVKSSKANAKNNQTSTIKMVKTVKAMSSLKGLVNGLIAALAPIDPIANFMIMSGIAIAILIPNIPSIAFNIIESLFFMNFIIAFIFSSLILSRFSRKNDSNNWKYIITALLGVFATIFVAPLLLEIGFYIINATNGQVINKMMLLSTKAFLDEAMKGDIWDLMANSLALIMWLFVLPYSLTMMIIRLNLAMIIATLRAMHVPTENLEKLYTVLNYIDYIIAIVCPVVLLFLMFRINVAKGAKKLISKKPKESKADSQTS